MMHEFLLPPEMLLPKTVITPKHARKLFIFVMWRPYKLGNDFYRLILALPPPAIWVSSSSVIWLVSPIVLISNAPCATPRLTHSCGGLPVRKPYVKPDAN